MYSVYDVIVKQQTGDHILQTGSRIRCHTHYAQGRSGCLAGHQIDGHKASKEADEHADGNTEQDHCQYVNPLGGTAEEEES